MQVLLLCRMVEPGQQEPVWSHSSGRVCTCPVLTGTAKVSVQREGLRAKQEPVHLTGVSTHRSFCLTKGSTDSSLCSSEVHGRARRKGRCQRVKCWLLPNPEQNSHWFQRTQLFILRFQGRGRLLSILSKTPTSSSSSTRLAPNLLVNPSSGPRLPLSLGFTTASQTLRQTADLALLIASDPIFYLLGHKQCHVLYDKDTCPSWM